jgi:hypothetical protein
MPKQVRHDLMEHKKGRKNKSPGPCVFQVLIPDSNFLDYRPPAGVAPWPP